MKMGLTVVSLGWSVGADAEEVLAGAHANLGAAGGHTSTCSIHLTSAWLQPGEVFLDGETVCVRACVWVGGPGGERLQGS